MWLSIPTSSLLVNITSPVLQAMLQATLQGACNTTGLSDPSLRHIQHLSNSYSLKGSTLSAGAHA